MKFSIYQNTRKGARKINQDRIAHSYSRDALLMVAADGMGGHSHGEIAAQIAVELMTETFQRQATPRLADPAMFLHDTLHDAHRAIHDYAKRRNLLETPRTTCVACVVQDSRAHWAHAGDSRLYLFRNDRLVAKTRDHSKIQHLLDRKLIREEEIGTHPERNKIYNCLGSLFSPEIELSRRTRLQYGDTILVCTDGLWGPFSDDELAEVLASGSIVQAVRELTEQAEFRGGKTCDNISLIGMTWGDVGVSLPGEISTAGMTRGAHTTRFGTAIKAKEAVAQDITDEEIDTVIAEIHSALKQPK